jgi:transposase
MRGKRTPWITYGFSKDHRPDLKQLLFCMTTTEDGGIPIQFRCYDGQTGDSPTHIDTWKLLRTISGKENFLYVADSKLCVRESMDYIDRRRGRFVTVLPRSRLEDAEFRKWIQTNDPQWEKVWDRPNARRKYGPRDRWYVFPAPIPSREAWPVIWVYSSLLALRHEQTRREQIAAAIQDLSDFKTNLNSNRSRIKKAVEVEIRVENILQKHKVKRYLKVTRRSRQECKFRQFKRGRPGPDEAYRKIVTRKWDIEWSLDNEAIEYDRKSDGMYPLLTNDRTLSPSQVLQAHKGQPTIEKRFEQIKTVHEIAPVFLKNEGRIEALFTLYFIGMLIQALIERQMRLAMKRNKIEKLPIYPEERPCSHPTTEQIFRLFSHFQQHRLFYNGSFIQLFNNDMTELQTEVLSLLGISKSKFKKSPLLID